MSFLPSQVYLIAPPLVGTMESAEREFAASLVVRACQVMGDKWQPITLKELSKVIESDLDKSIEPLSSLNRNPFFKPNFAKLGDGSYGRWIGESIELTDKGIESLKRWVVSPTEVK